MTWMNGQLLAERLHMFQVWGICYGWAEVDSEENWKGNEEPLPWSNICNGSYDEVDAWFSIYSTCKYMKGLLK